MNFLLEAEVCMKTLSATFLICIQVFWIGDKNFQTWWGDLTVFWESDLVDDVVQSLAFFFGDCIHKALWIWWLFLKNLITTVQVAAMQSHFIGAAFPQKFGAKKCPTTNSQLHMTTLQPQSCVVRNNSSNRSFDHLIIWNLIQFSEEVQEKSFRFQVLFIVYQFLRSFQWKLHDSHRHLSAVSESQLWGAESQHGFDDFHGKCWGFPAFWMTQLLRDTSFWCQSPKVQLCKTRVPICSDNSSDLESNLR